MEDVSCTQPDGISQANKSLLRPPEWRTHRRCSTALVAARTSRSRTWPVGYRLRRNCRV